MMLGKLLKFEFRDSGRVFYPLYIAGIVMAAIIGFGSLAGVSQYSDFAGTIHSLVSVLLVILVIALFVISFLLIIRKYFNGLLGEGGYFSFTIPATVHEHLGSKLICSVVMVLACILASVLMVLIANIPFWEDLFRGLGSFFQELGILISRYPVTLLVIVEIIAAILLSLCFSVLKLYLAMSLGHLSNTHRGILSILAYIVMGWVILLASMFIIYLLNQTNLFPAIFSVPDRNALTVTAELIGIYLGITLLGCVLLWFCSALILDRQLNIL